MATDSFNIYLSPVGEKSLNRFVINWQAGAKLIRHVRQYNGFATLNALAIKKRHDVFKFKGNSGLGGAGVIIDPYARDCAFVGVWNRTNQL